MIANADNFGVFVSSKNFENATDFEKVPHYDTRYKVNPISKNLMKKIRNPSIN